MGLVYGVGISDLKPRGRHYAVWVSMLGRCYSQKVTALNPTYAGCTVCESWHRLSNFSAWMDSQAWEAGLQLDKDLLVQGNKLYSPETCLLVSTEVNNFLTNGLKSRGEHPIGVSACRNKFKAFIRQGGKNVYLGQYLTPGAAHKAWLERKIELAIELASRQDSPKVSEALLKFDFTKI